jgi:hypothetical protein
VAVPFGASGWSGKSERDAGPVTQGTDFRPTGYRLPDNPTAPPSAGDPLEIDYFDNVDELNAFISRDAAEHQ